LLLAWPFGLWSISACDLQFEEATAGLVLVVAPSEGIEIALNGVLVSTESPYIDTTIPPGRHDLAIRAPGYAPKHYPVDLTSGRVLQLSVLLEPDPPVSTRAEAPTHQEDLGQQELLSQTTEEATRPVRLLLDAWTPGTPLIINNRRVRRRPVQADPGQGDIAVGKMRLIYAQNHNGEVTVTLPTDRARWFKDGRQVNESRSFAVSRGRLHLVRIGRRGKRQHLVVHVDDGSSTAGDSTAIEVKHRNWPARTSPIRRRTLKSRKLRMAGPNKKTTRRPATGESIHDTTAPVRRPEEQMNHEAVAFHLSDRTGGIQ
jgi:hypothetical protein